jgi:uncharacterized protein YoxC
LVKLLTGGLGSTIIYVVGAMLSTGLVVGGIYLHWKNEIVENALEKWNRTQTEQIRKDREILTKQQEEIQAAIERIQNDLARQNEALEKKIESINDFLLAPEIQKQDRPASEILKETIRRLK